MTAIASLSVTAEISHSVGNSLCLIFLTVVVIHLLSCVWLCDLMDCSLPGSSVLYCNLWGCSSSCPLSHWCYLTVSSSASPFSFCLQSFSASGSFHIIWLKYQSFSFSINPSHEYSVCISFKIDWLDLLAAQGTLKCLLKCKTAATAAATKSL